MIRSLYNIGSQDLPVLALSIHNGHYLSPPIEENTGISEADRLREEDPYTGLIAERFANHIIIHTSRFEVDLNRSFDKAVYQNPEDCWGLPARKVPLSPELLSALQDAYRQWYALLDYYVSRFLEIHKLLVVFDLHSFNHRRQGPDAFPDPQIENPDLIIGRSNLPDEYYPQVGKLRRLLDGVAWNGINLDCREDVKFTGGYLSRWLHQNTLPGYCPFPSSSKRYS